MVDSRVPRARAAVLALLAFLRRTARGEQYSAYAPYTGPPVALKHAPGGAGGAGASAVSDGAGGALAYFNARRAEVGLPPMAADPGVARAASAHARYLVLNASHGHDEIPGAPAFTGVDVTARIRLHAAVSGASEVLTVFGRGDPAGHAVEQVFASPYHRGVILFDWARAGAATEIASSTVIVVDFADIARTLADHELIAYPYDGQRDAPSGWTDNETPDPLASAGDYRGRRVGFPITLSGGPNAHIDWRHAELRDASGHDVGCQLAPAPPDGGRNTAVCTPLEPLAPRTRYTVTATGHLLQAFRNTDAPFSLQWTFTTASEHAQAESPRDGG